MSAIVPPSQRPEMDPGDELDGLLLSLMHERAVPLNASGSVVGEVLDNGVWIEVRSVIAGDPRVPGDVGRWLDTLPLDRKVIVPAVVSGRLAGMLERRGFSPERWYDARVGNFDDGAMVRRPREDGSAVEERCPPAPGPSGGASLYVRPEGGRGAQ